MPRHLLRLSLLTLLLTAWASLNGADGDGSVRIHGELKQWHAVTLDLAGPQASETGGAYNPFTDCRMTVVFRHESGDPVYHVPGYFATDGRAGESSAESGTTWRAHISPDKAGNWTYRIHFAKGQLAAIEPSAGEALAPYDGMSGQFVIEKSDKRGRDFRARGRLEYVGERYLRFADDGSYFLKAGPDAPETLLGYMDFDNTIGLKEKVPLKTWTPHVADWRSGDPTWQGGKGKGLVGAMNYVASKGLNAVSFLTYNAGGDGDNVWPFVDRDDKLRYDVSKLDQWNVIFSHAQANGVYLHFKLQENELDDNRAGAKRETADIPESMDGGLLGVERKLYLREMVARFGHHLALNWNLGEENTQTYEEQRDMAAWLQAMDPYGHLIVIHTFPQQQDQVYPPLLGANSALTGLSLQNDWQAVHQRTLKWIRAAELAGKTWVVANDEQNPAGLGVPPDPGYQGFDGVATEKERSYDLNDIRKYTLWGNLMAGGAGVEYYFGYKLPENDLLCEDYRSRDRSWDYCRVALEFFAKEKIPFWLMENCDNRVGNPGNANSRYGFGKPGDVYLVYLPKGGSSTLDLGGEDGSWRIRWFNPRSGGALQKGSVSSIKGGAVSSLGEPPADAGEDWLVVVRKR